MSDLIANGIAWLHGQQRTHVSGTVVYARGEATVSIPATRSRTEFESDNEYGANIAIHSEDFLIDPDDLDFGSGAVLPQPGDTITAPLNGVDQVYDVTPFGNEPHYRRTDAYGGRLRVHTKHRGPA